MPNPTNRPPTITATRVVMALPDHPEITVSLTNHPGTTQINLMIRSVDRVMYEINVVRNQPHVPLSLVAERMFPIVNALMVRYDRQEEAGRAYELNKDEVGKTLLAYA